MDNRTFQQSNEAKIERMANDPQIKALTLKWVNAAIEHEYNYHFSWLGVPIIQFPSDIVAMQEIVWKVKPDLIIETGIARGGSIIFHASMLELIGNNGHVVGIDVDIRKHNREEIEKHPMFKRITMIEGSSIDEKTVQQVYKMTENRNRIMVVLDSNHTYEHVLRELRLYSPIVSRGSYIVVFDTIIEDISDEFNKDRPWGENNNPKTAVHEFLKRNKDFTIDKSIENKLLVTVAPDGFLKRI